MTLQWTRFSVLNESKKKWTDDKDFLKLEESVNKKVYPR